MKKGLIVFLLICTAFPAAAFAQSKVGVAPGFLLATVEDPDGDADSYSGLLPLSLVFSHDLSNKTRIYSTFSYFSFDLDAGTDKIGQDISGYELAATWQRIFKLGYELHFFAGIGFGYTNADFTKRHTVDEDGYLARRYEDRSEGYLSIIGNISKEWEVTDIIDVGFNLSYKHALSDGVSGFNGAVTVMYKF